MSLFARTIGEEVRRLHGSQKSDREGRKLLERSLRTDVRKHLDAHQLDELKRLRALQGELFLLAFRAYQESGVASQELLELGGPLVELAENSFLDASRKLLIREEELQLLHYFIWTSEVGASDEEGLAPSLEEHRLYFSVLLRFPPTARKPSPAEKASVRLTLVEQLGRLDPTYPHALARGILELELGRASQAENALKAHLAEHPRGAYAKLAQNHLLYAHLLQLRED